MTRLLRRSALRHLARHPWQLAATLLGVTLAVAVVVGIDLANASAERSFRRSVEDVAGRATHEWVGGPDRLDQAAYVALRRSGLDGSRASAPIVEGRVVAAGRSLRLLGVDPLAEGAVRSGGRETDAASSSGLTGELGDPTARLGRADAVALSAQLAARLEEEGALRTDVLTVSFRGREHRLDVAERFGDAEGRFTGASATRDLLLVDLAAAQEILDRRGRLDRVDFAFGTDPPPAPLRAALDELAPGATLRTKESRAGALAEMTRAFRLNLSALGLLALVVGLFLVYNTLTFSVIQRRGLIGRLRALGTTRRQILGWILFEAGLLGAAGTLAGIALGWVLAHGLLGLVTQTLSDLYSGVGSARVEPALGSLAKAVVLGFGGSLLAALQPALEASNAPPRAVMTRSLEEQGGRRALWRLAALAGVLGLLAAGLLALPGRSLVLAFGGVFAAVLACAALVPGATFLAGRALARPAGAALGLVGRLAARGLSASLSRTGVATAALVVAIATTVGVGIMIDSFRQTLVRWLDTTLVADLYVTGSAEGPNGAALDPEWIDWARVQPGIDAVTTYRRVRVGTDQDAPNGGETQLHVLGLGRRAFQGFDILDAGPTGTADDALWLRFAAGEGVLASEPYAYRHALEPGDTIELQTDTGPRRFPVLAIFADYATDRGRLLIERGTYERFWRDRQIQSIALFLDPDAEAAPIAEALRARSGSSSDAAGPQVLEHGEIRTLSLEIFDRTFRITGVLRLLAIGVAFVGVLSALMALQLERARELAVLRAIGLLPRQLWVLVTTQTTLLGLVAGVLAAPFGVMMAALLVHVINKRSFGWTLALDVAPGQLVSGLVLSLVAALLAGLWPAAKMASADPARALREE